MEHFVLMRHEIGPDQTRIVEIEGTEIGIVSVGKRLFAYRNVCPHQGGPVCEGVRMPRVTMEIDGDGTFRRNNFDPEEMHLVCPWHGWEFRVDSGEAAGDPSIRLKSYPVIERDGKIYVRL